MIKPGGKENDPYTQHRYVALLSVVLALALTAVLAACGSDEPSGVTGPAETDREALVALYNATDGENWDESANWSERRSPSANGRASTLTTMGALEP